MFQVLLKGGWVMVPLVLCSLTALVIVVERIFYYCLNGRHDEQEFSMLKFYLTQGKLGEAKAAVTKWDSPLGRMTETGLRQLEKDPDSAEQAMENIGTAEVKKMQRGLGVLDTIVTASPLLGLLGTVTGIIRAFSALSLTGGTQSAQLGAGIAEALYATAFGLLIAIPSLFIVNLFYGIVDKRAQELTCNGQEVLALLKKAR